MDAKHSRTRENGNRGLLVGLDGSLSAVAVYLKSYLDSLRRVEKRMLAR